MRKKLVSLTLAVAVLMVPLSQAMADTIKPTDGGSVDLTNVRFVSNDLTTLQDDTGGGTWDYGTSPVISGFSIKKKVWSNYNHRTKIHSSTASIGTTISRSGQVNKEITSYASATGDTGDQTHAYWNTY